jgi:long-chain acyl-CoA synthetase
LYAELQNAWSQLTSPGARFEIVVEEVRGQPMRCYKNAPPTLRAVWDITAAHAADPTREYLVYGDERWSYARARNEVASMARWLQAKGVGSGDRVAIAMRNYPEWMLAYWACTSVGITVVGMNAWWTGPELVYGVDDSDPKVILADAERMERFDAHRDELGDRLFVGVRLPEARADVVPFTALTGDEQGDALPEAGIDPDDDACIFYTSGTTGRPKGAQLTHRGCVHNVMSMAFANTVQPMALGMVRANEAVADKPERVSYPPSSLIVTPLFHVTANNCVAQPMTLLGGKLVHMYKWDPAEALRLIEAERITVMSGVPVMARELIAHPDFETRDTSSLATLAGGGAQVQPDLVKKIDATVKTARPGTGYGMTETSGIITSVSSDFFVDRPDSAGRPMPCYEARIVGADGQEAPLGERGELCVRGAQVIKGYLNRPEATAETIQDGWLRTGDIARMDEDGFVYIVDRAKDMVLRGGENVYCAEVEAAIHEHPGVAECVVFGVPDDRLGEEVGAALVAESGETLDPEELRAFLRERLAGFKVPRYVWLLEQALPRNASGKFLKRELRERLDPADAA